MAIQPSVFAVGVRRNVLEKSCHGGISSPGLVGKTHTPQSSQDLYFWTWDIFSDASDPREIWGWIVNRCSKNPRTRIRATKCGGIVNQLFLSFYVERLLSAREPRLISGPGFLFAKKKRELGGWGCERGGCLV